MNALIVDDSRAMRCILRRMVEAIGFVVSEARDGDEAWQHMDSGQDTDLILVDWNMPVMNGLEFVKLVRNDVRFRTTGIVMVTTESGTTQMVRALLAGVDEFVTKPFTVEELQAKLTLIGVSVSSDRSVSA